MTQIFRIHPENPQPRLLRQTVDILLEGGVIVYPTDSGYALGCRVGEKESMERIRDIRRLDERHNFTLVCKDLSELAIYAHVDNSVFRLLKAYTPGAYTFILNATKEVPRRLQHPKRKTIGLRIPDNKVVLSLLEMLGEPLMSVTLILPGETISLSEVEDIYFKLSKQIDLVLDCGYCDNLPTTVIDFNIESGVPKIMRQGKGDMTPFLPARSDGHVKESFSLISKKLFGGNNA